MTTARERVEDVFGKAPFIARLGVVLVDVGDGWVETTMTLSDDLRQQHGFAHAGVIATLADHTAGAAASTVVADGQSVLTADYHISLLRPGDGTVLRSRGQVVRAGRRLIVAEANVWADERHCARYTGSMAVIDEAL